MLFTRRTAFFCSLTIAIQTVLFANQANADERRIASAVATIQAEQLQKHVEVLADDIYEGRKAGSRGGRASSQYITGLLKTYQLQPAGIDGGYYQPCQRSGYRNILAVRRGTDPKLKDEVIVVGAHYDHVGYGDNRTSFGPVGYIHNGADDNASGVSVLLETIEAFQAARVDTRRTILFAFWDGEEQGLIGSKHWTRNPTVPIKQVKLAVNIDMVGRMRNSRLEVGGTRTGVGMRKLLAMPAVVQHPLWVDYSWEYKANSDHWTFFKRGIPSILLHTGLHDQYHRPSDDVELINKQGMEKVSRYLFHALVTAADAETLPTYRAEGGYETPSKQKIVERPLPQIEPRTGIGWKFVSEGNSHVAITQVAYGSSAQLAGLRSGDRVEAINGLGVTSANQFNRWLASADGETVLEVGRAMEVDLHVTQPPVRLGISWRTDIAEPGAVYITRVVPGSPAELAGLKLFDRIYELDGEKFANKGEFQSKLVERLDDFAPEVSFQVESKGRLRTVRVELEAPRIARVNKKK